MRPSCGLQPVGDVHAGHDLQPLRDRRPVLVMERADLAHRAVDPIAQAEEQLLGLEMDVGGAELDRIEQDRVDQPHQGMGVAGVDAVEVGEVALPGLELLDDAVDRHRIAVGAVDQIADRGRRADLRHDRHVVAELAAQLIEGEHVVGVAHRHEDVPALAGQRHHAVAERDLLRDPGDHLGIDHRGRGVELLVARGLGEQRGERGMADEAEVDQDGAEHLAGALLLEQRDLELIEGDQAEIEQAIADPGRGLLSAVGSAGAAAALASARPPSRLIVTAHKGGAAGMRGARDCHRRRIAACDA